MKTVDYEKYLFYDDIEKHLMYLKEKHPEYMKLHILDVTDEGRNIYLAEVSENVSDEKTKEKGGYYVQGSIHANECGGSSAAMHLLDTLLSDKPEILKDVVFYILPRVNPDGVESNMLHNTGIRSKYADNTRNKENVLVKKDLDGDGKILQIRKENPLGNYKEIAPGVMVPREAGEFEGVFYDIYDEGIIENFSDLPVNSSKRSYDFNRCYSCTWKPTQDSTEYPFREKEIRAVGEFLVTHPNIFAGLDFHNGTNGVLRPAMKDDSKMNRADLNLILSVGKKASEITGLPLIAEYSYGQKTPVVRNGGANEFWHYNLGCSHYVIELGNGLNDIGLNSLEFYESGRTFESYFLEIKEYEEKTGNPVFFPFKPYKHPQLGDVEIGGSMLGRCYFMNSKNIAPLVAKTTAFALEHAKMGPALKIDNCEVLALGDNIIRLRAQVKNEGIFGTKIIKESESYQASYPVHIYLEKADGTRILSRPNIYEIPSLDSMESTYVEWFVKAETQESITIVANHPKCKPACAKVYIKEV